MPSSEPRGNVVKLKLNAARAQAQVRELAQDTGTIILTDHARERMEQRGFVMRDLLRILRTGYVDDAPIGLREGDWQCKMTQQVGGREAGAVTIIVQAQQLVIRTVEWEDGK